MNGRVAYTIHFAVTRLRLRPGRAGLFHIEYPRNTDPITATIPEAKGHVSLRVAAVTKEA